jgi:putative hydrolase of the HAD superfamily
MPTIRAIYFDAVGTLLFPEPPAEQVYAAFGQRYGQKETAEVIRHRLRSAFQAEEQWDRQHHWRVDPAREEQRWQRIVRACFPQIDSQSFAQLFTQLYDYFAQSSAWRLADQAVDVLTKLQQCGLIVGVASNYDGRLRRVLQGIAEVATVHQRLILSVDVGYRKPAAAFFAAVVSQAGCAAGEVLYVGDDLDNDYKGAQAAGLQAVLYRPTEPQHATFPLRHASTASEGHSTIAVITHWNQLLSLITPRL